MNKHFYIELNNITKTASKVSKEKTAGVGTMGLGYHIFKKKGKSKEKTATASFGASEGRVEEDPNLPENQHQEDDTKHRERMDDIKEMLKKSKKKRILVSKTLKNKDTENSTKIRQRKSQDYMEEDGKSDIYMEDKEKHSHVARKKSSILRIGGKRRLKKVCGGLTKMKKHKARTKKYTNYSLKMF